MKFEVYRKRFSDTVCIVGEKKFPHGVNLADPCYPCLWISLDGHGIKDGYISISDSFWADADVERDPNRRSVAYENAGGKDRVREILDSIPEPA